jgi:hypothetical protein
MKILIRGINETSSITCINISQDENSTKPLTFKALLEKFIFKNYYKNENLCLLTDEYCFSRDGKNISLNEIIPDSKFIYQLEKLKKGGKGGFGSLLKGQPPVKKRTNNFESMRDLTGRRMRHVNQERTLKEWHQKKIEEEKMIQTYNNPQKEANIKDYIDSDKRKEIQKLNKKFVLDSYETTESITDSIKFLMKKQMRESNKQSEMKNINQIPYINQRSKEAKEELKNFLKSLNNVQVSEKEEEKKTKNTKKGKTSSTKAKKSQKKEEENVYNVKKLEEEVFSLDF